MYGNGSGVSKNLVVAYALSNLAAAGELSSSHIASEYRSVLAKKLNNHEIEAAQALTRSMERPGDILKAMDNYINK